LLHNYTAQEQNADISLAQLSRSLANRKTNSAIRRTQGVILSYGTASVSVRIYITKTDEWLNSTFRALNIPSNVTFRLYIVSQLNDVHENFHL